MLRRKTTTMLCAATLALAAACAHAGDVADRSHAEVTPPFSGPDNVAYARLVWTKLQEAGLVGPDAMVSHPYFGNPPHGGVLEFFERDMTIDGHTGVMMVKNNYKGETGDPAALAAALNDRQTNLAAVTIMFQREAGYDEDNDNWFWAKYLPDGSLDRNPKGMQLAGRVAKGADAGCIACHQAAPGDDLVFTHDKMAK